MKQPALAIALLSASAFLASPAVRAQESCSTPIYSPTLAGDGEQVDQSGYLPLASLQNPGIEVVRNYTVFDKWQRVLEGDPAFQEWSNRTGRHVSDFEWLTLRYVSVGQTSLPVEDGGKVVSIPIKFYVRFVSKHAFEADTMPVIGRLRVDPASFKVRVCTYGDSSVFERGRRGFGAIDQYDGSFVQGLAGPLLAAFFRENPAALAELIKSAPPLGAVLKAP